MGNVISFSAKMPGVLHKPEGFEPLGDLLGRGAAMRGSFRRIVALQLRRRPGARLSLFATCCFGALLHCLHPRTEGKPSYRVRAAPAMGWARLRFERQEPSRHLPSGIHPASASHTRIALKFASFHRRLVVIPLTDMRTKRGLLDWLRNWPFLTSGRGATLGEPARSFVDFARPLSSHASSRRRLRVRAGEPGRPEDQL